MLKSNKNKNLIDGSKFRFFFSDMDNTLLEFWGARVVGIESVIDFLNLEFNESYSVETLFSYFHRKKYNIEDMRNIYDFLVDFGVYSDSVFSKCKLIYESSKMDSVQIYEGVIETIRFIRNSGFSFIVVTDAEKYHAERRLLKTKLLGEIDGLSTSDMSGFKKPSLEVFEFALEKYNADPKESVFIGDSIYRDIMPAQKLEMKTIYAKYGTYGLGNPSSAVISAIKDVNPDYSIGSFSEIVNLIKKRNDTI